MHRHVLRTAGLWTLACSALPALAAAQTPLPRERTDSTSPTQEWPQQSQRERGMKRMPGMSDMSGMRDDRNRNPHHQLAAAYHANFVTFTRLMHENAQGGEVGQTSGQNSWQNEQNQGTTSQPGESSEPNGGKSNPSDQTGKPAKTGQSSGQSRQSGPIGTTEFRDLARTAVTEMQRSFDEMGKHHLAFGSAKATAADSTRTTDMKDMAQHQTAIRALLASLRKEVDTDSPNSSRISTLASDILRETDGMPGMREQPVRSARMR